MCFFCVCVFVVVVVVLFLFFGCLLLVLFYCLFMGFLFDFLVCTEFDAGVAVVVSFFLLYAFAFF